MSLKWPGNATASPHKHKMKWLRRLPINNCIDQSLTNKIHHLKTVTHQAVGKKYINVSKPFKLSITTPMS